MIYDHPQLGTIEDGHFLAQNMDKLRKSVAKRWHI